MEYRKPYLLSEHCKAWKHVMRYKWQERKTKPLVFSRGKSLPYDSGNPNLEYTKQDPATYDLIFHSEVEPSVFCKYDNLPNNGNGLLLVNQKIINILQEMCPDDFQIFPATIISDKPKKFQFENHDYWVLNLTKTVDVIDDKNSTFTLSESGNIDDAYKIICREDSMGNHHIARMYKNTVDIVISLELRQRLKKEKITGIKIETDEEAYPYVPKTETLLSYYYENDLKGARSRLVSILCNRSLANELLLNIKQVPDDLARDLNKMFREVIPMVLSSSDIHKIECEEILHALNDRIRSSQQ